MTKLHTLEQHLEECLTQEGLYDLLPESRRETLYNRPFVFMWFSILWIPQIFLILKYTHLRSWLVAVLLMPSLLLISLLLLVVFLVVKDLPDLKRKKELSTQDASWIGGFLLLIFPAMLVLSTALYLKSLSALLYQLGFSILGVVFFFLLYTQRSRVHLLFEFVRSAFRALVRSVPLMFVLLPVLLVVVLLSVFSSDLWSALGTLSFPRLISGMLLLLLPGALLLFAVLHRTALQVVGDLPTTEQIIDTAEHFPLLHSKLERGFISDEEWTDAKRELGWRHRERLSEQAIPIIIRKVRLWLALLIVVTSAVITLTVFIYFFALFHLLLQPKVIAQWVGIPLTLETYSLALSGYSLNIDLYSTEPSVLKVSLLLSVFIALASTVYSLTDDTASDRLTAWLVEKARSWLSLTCIYDGISCPHYQIWRYLRKDKKRGLVNVTIVVPEGSADDDVKRACEHLEERLSSFRSLVYIMAYEQNLNTPVYENWISGKRWQLINNKINGSRSFDPFPALDDEAASQPFLGRECLEMDKQIPDEWFGIEAEAVAISKQLWDADPDHSVVLHPHSIVSGSGVFVEARLMKRLVASESYRKYTQSIVSTVFNVIPAAETVSVTLTFRETSDTLASLWLHRGIESVSYLDEIDGRSKNEKLSSWIRAEE